jgi:hypothetical protein
MPHPVPPGRASEPRPGQHGVRPALNPRPGVLEAPFWVRWAWAGSPATPPLDRAAPSDAAGTPACPASVVRGAGRRGGDELGPAQAVKAALDRDPALGAVDGDAQAATRSRRRSRRPPSSGDELIERVVGLRWELVEAPTATWAPAETELARGA